MDSTYFIKMSATMFIPRNIHSRKTKYKTARNGLLSVVIPGKRNPLII